MPIVGAGLLGVRYYYRHKRETGMGIDDWILLPALVLIWGMGASLIAGVALHSVAYPTPRTFDPHNPESVLTTTNYNITVTSKVEYAFSLMQVLQLGCVKLSFLFFYRRIFIVSKRWTWFNIATLATIVLVVLWTLAFFLTELLECVAVGGSFSSYWGSAIDLTTKCVKTELKSYAYAVSDFITDAIVFLLPIPMVWSLHMTAERKLGVSLVFALGIVAVAASVVRMKFYIDAVHSGFDPTMDEDLTITSTLYWDLFESGVGFVAVCLPTLRPAFGKSASGSWLRSVRSVFSLRSLGSNGQRSTAAARHHGSESEVSIRSDTHSQLDDRSSTNKRSNEMFVLEDMERKITTRREAHESRV